MNKRETLALVFVVLSLITPARADHGPGTSGSGFTTLTAETLKPGSFSSTFQFDWTEFDVPSGDVIGVDLLDRSFLSTLNVSYGVADNFQLGLTYGYFAAEGNREFEEGEDGEEPELSTFDPDGFTDLWLTGKYRFYQGPAGQVALIGGIKFPTGDSRLTNSEGEQVEPAATAGTGAWDGMAGLAYTVPLNAALTLDASALYTFRGERYDYRLGDRLDVGTSLAWRVCGNAKTYPQVSLVAEATLRHVQKSEEEGESDGSTGGTVIFLSPGVKASFTERCAASVGVQLPVVQDLNGNQAETAFRLITGVSFSF
ncbi:MAG: transporter [Verrucomicrobiaceae bacterium]|nr:transporter [Verrucomicrobiaceae bacterium]